MSSVRFNSISANGRGQFGDPPLSTAPTPHSKIDPSVWEGLRDRITQLYSVENKSLDQVRGIIEVEQHFSATLSEWRLKISEWHLNNLMYRRIKRRVRRTNENAGSSPIRQTGQAARTGSGKIEEISRDPDNMATPSLSKHHSNRSVKEDGIYMKGKQLVNDSKEKEGVSETNRILQTKLETNKSHLIPAKDTDWKFPCPHCTKTYFHPRHLKHHLLQHTRDRPYKCMDCSDTFFRVHNLKAHYHTCSIRRGNSGGSSDGLSAQANLKTLSTLFVPTFGKELDMPKADLEFVKTRLRRTPAHPQVIRAELLAGRELELAQEKINALKMVEEAPQSAEPEELDSDLGSFHFIDTHLRREDGADRLGSMTWASTDCNQVDYEPLYVSDNFDSRFQFLEADQDAEMSSNDSSLSDGESTDTVSTWISDYSGIHLLEKDHPFNLIKSLVVQKGLLAYQNAKQPAQEGSSSSATSDGPNTALAAKNLVSTLPKKRRRKNQGGSEDTGDTEDDEDLTAKRRRTSKREAGNQASFACPFAKKDPLRYRSCCAYVLKRVRDVKQHLSRFHQLPIYCPRCTETFETEDERDEHIRACSCLVQQDAIAFEGVTRAQKIFLGQKVSGKMTPSDQWFTIFDILFPGYTPRPRSAYINTDLTMELEAFQDLMYAEGPRLISSTIRSMGLDTSAMENVADDSTALLQSAIQDGLQQVFQRWLENMPGYQQGSAKLSTLCRFSTSPTCHGMQGSEPSRSSSNTPFEDIQETSAPTEQANSFLEYARYQDHAVAQRISSSSDLASAASTPLDSNTDQKNSNPIRNTDIQPVVHDEDVIGDAAHLDSLAADGWEAFEIDTLESGDSWNFDAAFDEAGAM